LIDLFGKCRHLKELGQVLDGHFTPPPQCDPCATQFLLVVSQPAGVEDVALQSNQTYCWGWQKAREATGSLAFNIHFGHYMARTFNLEISVINVTMANIPL